jgi:putative redox protein
MEKVAVVSERSPYVVEVSASKHKWFVDEPPDRGGEDKGPTPYELLLGAVGACTAITARMYAQRKGWSLRSIKVELEHTRVRAEDCPDCETAKGYVSQVGLQVSVEGDLDDFQRQRIFEIAGKCPVKRTLEGEIRIRSELLDQS